MSAHSKNAVELDSALGTISRCVTDRDRRLSLIDEAVEPLRYYKCDDRDEFMRPQDTLGDWAIPEPDPIAEAGLTLSYSPTMQRWKLSTGDSAFVLSSHTERFARDEALELIVAIKGAES